MLEKQLTAHLETIPFLRGMRSPDSPFKLISALQALEADAPSPIDDATEDQLREILAAKEASSLHCRTNLSMAETKEPAQLRERQENPTHIEIHILQPCGSRAPLGGEEKAQCSSENVPGGVGK